MSVHGWQYLSGSDKRAILAGIESGHVRGGPFHVELQPSDRQMRLHPNRGAFARPPRAFRGVRSRDAESAGLGDVFLDAVEHGVAGLKAQPGLGTPIRREMRWFVIARFPFSIVYRVDRGTRGGTPASTFWRSLTREGAHCIGPAVVEVAARRTMAEENC